MRQYKYDTSSMYIGFIVSNELIENSTIVKPASIEHTHWNGSSWNIPTEIILTLDELKTNKIKQVRNSFDEIAKQIETDAANFEIKTWETQRQEWNRYLEDTNANTPYCDTLALTRGISKENLMTRIGNNVVKIAQAQGTLHLLEDAITASQTEEQLNQISW